MKKLLAMLLMLMLLVCGTAGAMAEEEKDISEYTVVMIVKQSDSWFDDMEVGVNQLAADTGLNCYVLFPESGDAALQISLMEDLISVSFCFLRHFLADHCLSGPPGGDEKQNGKNQKKNTEADDQKNTVFQFRGDFLFIHGVFPRNFLRLAARVLRAKFPQTLYHIRRVNDRIFLHKSSQKIHNFC